ncbi:MAG: di-heme-cytochrome C peroxidase [Terracidiphilus sp.]
MVNFERNLPNEELDAANIVRGILKVQAAYAAAQDRPLGRGTHTKGVCARATFEVFDLSHKIHDHTVAARLAHGIYAKPGVYPATVRFANAASTIYPDHNPDLRAMSFSVELPPELAATSKFQDYSLQSNPVFPINDSHSFAVLMQVLSAGSNANQLKAMFSLSFPDFFQFLKAAVLGKIQVHGEYLPYQKIRFWSTVPFRNGPYEAVKYSATPSADNSARELRDEPNALRDELIRHLNEDAKMSSFDIGLQLLDTQHMTQWGMHREASFWVENATVEWKESQAPFHVVGRLTLVPKSAMEVTACEPRYIDVTDHATADTQPLGSINRARKAAEIASRKVRLGEATVEEVLETLPTAPPVPRSLVRGLLRFAAVALVVIFAGYFLAGFVYHFLAGRNVPAAEHVDAVRYLDQGWGLDRESPERELYYYTAQGSGMHGVRYSWFVNLEQPFSKTRITDPEHMRALDFIVDPAATPKNPDQLPIGFARRYDDTIHDHVVDITCAACHTGQLNVKSATDGTPTAIRIDGGQSMSAFTDVNPGSFQLDLGLSIGETLTNPFKFNRFAAKVLGPDANTIRGKLQLWSNLASVEAGLGKVFMGSSGFWHYPVQEGYGRTDALTRIGNVVFGDHVSSKNYMKGDAPVSYPYLWNIWKFNWVQYNASVSQPMARNVSEAMGVGADFRLLDDYGRPIPASERYDTTVQFDNLQHIETTLQKLKPPQWPEDLLGKIDKKSSDRGEALFMQHCAHCHGPHVASQAFKDATSPGQQGRQKGDPLWVIRYIDVEDVGTDSTAADNFYKNRVDLTRSGITFDDVKPLLVEEYQKLKVRNANLATDLPKEIPLQEKMVQSAKEESDKAKAEFEAQKTRFTAMTPTLQKDAKMQVDSAEMHAREALEKYEGAQLILDEYNQELSDATTEPVDDAYIAQQIGSIDMSKLSSGEGLSILGMIIRKKYYTDRLFSPEAQACFSGFDTLDMPQVAEGYKPRPLQGVWATPPFLHNGSVPNLWELLGPVSKRSPKFFVGRRGFDPVHVGYATEPAKGSSGGFWMDTTIAGNHNTGHEFADGYVQYNPDPKAPKSPPGIIGPALSDQDRTDIIEYLKIRQDQPDAPERKPVDCFALLK